MTKNRSEADCVFCRIVAGEIPSRVVHADDTAIAFLDVEPFKTGHTLVVPREHVSDALAAPNVLAAIAPAIAATGRLLMQRLGASGLNILSNVGADAGQSLAPCERDLLVGERLSLTYRFPRQLLGDWRALDAAVAATAARILQTDAARQ